MTRLAVIIALGLVGCLTIDNSTQTPAPAPTVGTSSSSGGTITDPDSGDAQVTVQGDDDDVTVPKDAGSDSNVNTTPTNGTYFASCLSELANGNVKKTFSFWATVAFTPGTNIKITLEALKLENGLPPTTISHANVVSTLPLFTGADNAGSFNAGTGTGDSAFSGTANPISGSDVVIQSAALKGRFAADKFCARLLGHIKQPAAAERDLDENKNVCLFTPITEGGSAPARVFADYSVTNCPL